MVAQLVNALTSSSSARLAIVITTSMIVVQALLQMPDSAFKPPLFVIALAAMLSAIPFVARWLNVGIPIVLLQITIIGHLFYGDLDIGPFSIRVYTAAALLAYAALTRITKKTPIFSHRWSIYLTVGMIALMVWRVAARYQQVDSFSGAGSTISILAFSLSVFFLIQRFVRSASEIRIFAWTLMIALLLSSAVATLQWMGVDLAWDAAVYLRPGREALVQGWGSNDTAGQSPYAPGLTLFSVQLGYHLATFGSLLVAWLLIRNAYKYSVPISFVVSFILGLSLLATQSRSALLSVVLILIFLFFAWLKFRTPFQFDWIKVFGPIVLSGLVLGLVVNGAGLNRPPGAEFVKPSSVASTPTQTPVPALTPSPMPEPSPTAAPSPTTEPSPTAAPSPTTELSPIPSVLPIVGPGLPPLEDRARPSSYSLDRIWNLSDNARVSVGLLALEEFWANPIWGVSNESFLALQLERLPQNNKPITPHNMFLNPLVFSGTVGIIIVSGLTSLMFFIAVKTILVQRVGSLNWVAVGSLAGIIGFTVNAQFHNNGIYSEAAPLWWLVGICISIMALPRRQNYENSEENSSA